MPNSDYDEDCADCGTPKTEDPSTMPGDDLCGECRAKQDKRKEEVHLLRKGGESWCGGHHVRASLKRATVTCADCLAADSRP